MVSVLVSSGVDRGFEPRSVQTKDYKIGICCSSTKRTALGRKSKDWLVQNWDNVSEWGDMSSHGLLFQWASTIKSNSACWSRTKWTSLSSHWKLTCSRHDIAEKIAELAWNNNHSLQYMTLIQRYSNSIKITRTIGVFFLLFHFQHTFSPVNILKFDSASIHLYVRHINSYMSDLSMLYRK